jgi:hypothetical protein
MDGKRKRFTLPSSFLKSVLSISITHVFIIATHVFIIATHVSIIATHVSIVATHVSIVVAMSRWQAREKST